MLKRRATVGTAVLGGILLSAASMVSAGNLRYATGFAPETTGALASQATADYLSEITNGEMTMEVYAQSLLGFGEMNAGVRDGIADAGYVLAPYAPAEYPNMNFIHDLNMIMTVEQTGDRGGLAWAGALSEYVKLHCDNCQSEIKAQNQVFTEGAIAVYDLLCTKPVQTADDVKGLKIRTIGGNWSRWIENFGGTPVSLSFAETYEGLSQGIVDCTIASSTELVDQGLIDVIKSVTTDVPSGLFGGSMVFNINLDTWRAMTVQERESYAKAASYGGALMTWEYRKSALGGHEKAAEVGIPVVQADPDFRDATSAWIKQDMDAAVESYSTKRGVGDTQEMRETFSTIYRKWAGLVETVETPEALADLMWQEVGSKIDYSAYGL